MNKKIPSSTRKLIAAGTILLLLLFATSTMNYSYAVNKNTLQNRTFPSPAPLPIQPPEFPLPIQSPAPLPIQPPAPLPIQPPAPLPIQPPAPLPIPPPGLLGTLIATTKVSGGNKNPSDFTITVKGASPSPASFAGSSSGTTVTLKPGRYSVTESSISGYTTTYSSGCSGSIGGAQTIKCTITNKYTPPPGSTTFLSVITNVDNTDGGTKKPSDFTITVSGNSPSPSTFSGSSSGTSVTLRSGSYEVTENGIPNYRTSYSTYSGTASGGVPIKCTITNQYHTPSPPAPPIKPSLTITADSSSVYSIPSTFVKVDRFSTNYTIAGEISSINASRDLITSTIVDDFDKNPNIGYVVSNSSSLSIASQPGLPNPFVSQGTINQKITNETQNAISTASVTNPTGKNVEIKCNFGMILADYKCS